MVCARACIVGAHGKHVQAAMQAVRVQYGFLRVAVFGCALSKRSLREGVL